VTDPVLEKACALLAIVKGRLGQTDEGLPGRASLVPGGAAVAWDDCCEGQLWVRIGRIFAFDRFPEPATGALRCETTSWAAEYEVGVLRCAATVDDNGDPPTVEQLLADVERSMADAAALRQALLYDFGGEFSLVAIGQWLPTEVEGACVGGTMTVTVPV
jgi:hypothetical protein